MSVTTMDTWPPSGSPLTRFFRLRTPWGVARIGTRGFARGVGAGGGCKGWWARVVGVEVMVGWCSEVVRSGVFGVWRGLHSW